MRSVRIPAGLLILLLATSARPARSDDRTMLAETPATTAYRFASHPMIAGTVFSVNDHQMVVDTDQGERVTLQMDSRTMAPKDLAPGMEVRADFLALDDCRFRAQRVTVIREGMPAERHQGYAVTTDSPGSMMRNTTYRRNFDRPSEARIEESPTASTIRAIPGTAAYRFATTPMISGVVVAVNDHRMVVETDQGIQTSLVLDSRTMVPAELEPVSYVRAEFKEMKDGRYYATRIHQVREPSGREQAYARTRDSDFQVVAQTDPCGAEFATPSGTTTSSYDEYENAVNADAMAASSERNDADAHSADARSSSDGSAADQADAGGEARGQDRDHDRMPDTLPQTDSRQSLILALGLFALVSAGFVRILRGPRKA